MDLVSMRATRATHGIEQLQVHAEGGFDSIAEPGQNDVVPHPGLLDHLKACTDGVVDHLPYFTGVRGLETRELGGRELRCKPGDPGLKPLDPGGEPVMLGKGGWAEHHAHNDSSAGMTRGRAQLVRRMAGRGAREWDQEWMMSHWLDAGKGAKLLPEIPYPPWPT